MKAIFLKESDSTTKLSGKIVKEISFCNTGKSHLIITFTDDTYIMIEPSEDWESLMSVETLPFESQYPVMYGRFDEKLIPEYLQKQIDVGVTSIDLDKIQEIMKKWEEAEYQNYLILKEKYEGYSK